MLGTGVQAWEGAGVGRAAVWMDQLVQGELSSLEHQRGDPGVCGILGVLGMAW